MYKINTHNISGVSNSEWQIFEKPFMITLFTFRVFIRILWRTAKSRPEYRRRSILTSINSLEANIGRKTAFKCNPEEFISFHHAIAHPYNAALVKKYLGLPYLGCISYSLLRLTRYQLFRLMQNTLTGIHFPWEQGITNWLVIAAYLKLSP